MPGPTPPARSTRESCRPDFPGCSFTRPLRIRVQSRFAPTAVASAHPRPNGRPATHHPIESRRVHDRSVAAGAAKDAVAGACRVLNHRGRSPLGRRTSQGESQSPRWREPGRRDPSGASIAYGRKRATSQRTGGDEATGPVQPREQRVRSLPAGGYRGRVQWASVPSPPPEVKAITHVETHIESLC